MLFIILEALIQALTRHALSCPNHHPVPVYTFYLTRDFGGGLLTSPDLCVPT